MRTLRNFEPTPLAAGKKHARGNDAVAHARAVGVRSARSSARSNTRAIWALLCVSALVVTGCSSTSPVDSSSAEGTAVAKKAGVRTEKELGPVHVTVEVVPAPARLSDEPKLTLTVVADRGVDVTLPPFGDAVGDFLILDFREPLVEVRGERQVIRQIYTLEPPRTGTLEVDPITVTFSNPTMAAETQIVETEALAIEVVSLIDAEAPSLDALQGYEAPVDLSPPIVWWPWVVGAMLGSISLAGAIFWLRWRRAQAKFVPQPSPREIASLELQRIWQEQLHLHDIKAFYTELTGIVRRYIEGTVGVHAPEQTTEEFLREISQGNVFSVDERQRLRDFLESSDLVKFAAHRPLLEDVDDAYRRARAFVGIAGEPTSQKSHAENQQVPAHD